MVDPLTVLVVDDEVALAGVVAGYLEKEGFTAIQAHDGPTAVAMAQAHKPDLIVLDVMLPGFDGVEVCRQVRQFTDAYIIMLTARDEEVDKVVGLEIGADDYITKPFSIREFRSRVRALLRRATGPRHDPRDGETIEISDLRIDLARRSVDVRGEAVPLTYVEFELLRTLAAHPGRVYTREMLLESLWGGSDYREPRTIDVHVRHIREKIERDPREPEMIFTVRGVGYRFRDR